MSSIFCCPSISPYRPQRTEHESKFTSFQNWASFPKESSIETQDNNTDPLSEHASTTYVIQAVRQVNFGPLESRRYFASSSGAEPFIEVAERNLIDANYEKVNSYKNFKCTVHNKFFELNLYQKNPVNKHHWRANIARPAGEIDL